MEKSEKVAILAVVINLILFGIKYAFSIFSGSIALKAEALDSLVDVVAFSTVFAGLKIAKRKTKSFPYGLYKVENFVSLLIAFAIFYAGYLIVIEAMKGSAVELQNVWITCASVLVVIVISYFFSRYEAKVGKAINSPSLIAEAKHTYTDIFANVVVLIALFSNYVDFDLDKIAAFIIAAFIAWSGGKILIDCIRVLLDASLDYKTLSFAEKLISAEPQVFEIQNLMGRNSGRYKFIEANIVLKTHDLDKAHFIADRIEKSIKEKIKNVDNVHVHYEPVKKEHFIYAIPLNGAKGHSISLHFGSAPCFMFVTVKTGKKKLVKKEIVKNPFAHMKEGKGILVAEFLIKQHIDVLLVKETFEGKGPSYVFSDSAIEVLMIKEEKPKSALEKLGII